jgi:arginyl-tRNA synthetase
METYLQKIISQALLKLGLSEEQLPNIKIETPKDPSHGDAATNG